MTAIFSLPAQVTYYTTSTMQVGPGVTYKKFIAPLVPWTLDVLEIDLTNDYISVETLKANNLLAGRETPSSMSSRNSYGGHRVVGAVNGDFYDGNGIPIGSQVLGGQILKGPINRSVIGFNTSNLPMAGVVSFSGALVTAGLQRAINGINQTRGTDQLIFYNRFYGSSSGTNVYGTEMQLSTLNGWQVNDTVYCLVDTVITGVGNIGLVSGKAVLSGHGTAADFLQTNIEKGDTVKLSLSLLPGLAGIKELVGGFPKIVKNGSNYALQGYAEEGGAATFATDRHPRTAAGFSADSTVLYLVTVDGRQSTSAGMNLIELADFMVGLGVATAVNLDGGGSTTLVLHDQVQNSPSDGSERPVTNALAVVSSAAAGSLRHIQIKPDYYRIFIGKSLQFAASGWDEYYNPVSIEPGTLSYAVPEFLGNIDNSGKFTAAQTVDSGYVSVSYGNMQDSAYIRLKTAKRIEISPKRAVTDTIETIRFRMIATDEDNLPAPLVNTDYQWSCLNPEIGEIDSSGVFNAKSEGSTAIVATFAGLADTAFITVEVHEGTVLLDSLDTANEWSISGIYYEPSLTNLTVVDTPKTIGSKALKLDYTFIRSSLGRSYIYLNTDIQILGVPDSLLLDVKSDGQAHWIKFMVSDNDGERFLGSTGQFADRAAAYETLVVPTDKFAAVNPPADFQYPIRFKAVEIRLGFTTVVGDTNSGFIYLDNLRVVYPDLISYIPLLRESLPEKVNLDQNYPNPFNSRTSIQFGLSERMSVKLEVFDLRGRKVAELLNRMINAGYHTCFWEAGALASGIYFYRLQTANYSVTRKMMLIR